MKIFHKFLTLAFIFHFLIHVALSDSREMESDYEIAPVKDILFELGYGKQNLSLGFGFRYDFASLTIGATGFNNDMPNYQTDLRYQPAKKDFEERRYSSISVSIDLGLYYDVNDLISVCGNIGWYSQADTILAYYWEDETLYAYKNETVSGLCFGGGFQYFVSDFFTLGAFWHSKRGFCMQLGYYWL